MTEWGPSGEGGVCLSNSNVIDELEPGSILIKIKSLPVEFSLIAQPFGYIIERPSFKVNPLNLILSICGLGFSELY